jgi:MFS family permease
VARPLPRTVRALGAVSLLNDASSEMIYPLLPSFLTRTLGAGPVFLGLVEGLAEAAASLVKVASGWLSDRLQRRKPLVVSGYSLSAASRPAMALAGAPWHVLAVRLADRMGKGARGAPRDALLADATPEDLRGRAYGFHRAMDHLGALIGPLLASAVLLVRSDLRLVFALAVLPAAAAVIVLAATVPEERRPDRGPAASSPSGSGAPLSRPFLLYLAVLAVFTLGNSSDAFLLLRAQQAGLALPAIPLLWSFHNLVKSATSTHGGVLSDRIGRKAAILLGWLLYAAAYAGFAWASGPAAVVVFFGVYGLHHALTEGPERALVADLAAGEARGRAFGLYHAVSGGMLLPASLLTGALWQGVGAPTALLVGAGLAAVAAAGLLLLVPEPRRPRE